MTDTLTNQSAALKEYYAPDVCQNLIFKDCPFFAMVKKDKAFGGKTYLRIPFIWGNAAGISTNFTYAQVNGLATYMRTDEVQVSRVKTHSIGYIDNELIRATKNDMRAFVQSAKVHVDGIITNLSRDLEIAAFREGYAYRGRLSHTQSLSATTLTLSQASDALNFEVGMRCDLTAAVGSTAAAKAYGSSGNPLIITGVNYKAGTLTIGYALNDATNGIPTVAVDDYIMLQGDVGTSSTNYYRTKPTGLLGWAPDSAPGGSDNFFGLNRSVNSRLYGQVVDASSGLSLVEALNEGASILGQYGGNPSHAFASWTTYKDLINTLEGKVQIIEKSVGSIGFRGVKLITPRGEVEVYPSIGCDDKHLWLVDLKLWGLYTLDEPVQVSDEDGLEMVRAYNADACEVRYKTMGNFGCVNPAAGVCNIIVRS